MGTVVSYKTESVGVWFILGSEYYKKSEKQEVGIHGRWWWTRYDEANVLLHLCALGTVAYLLAFRLPSSAAIYLSQCSCITVRTKLRTLESFSHISIKKKVNVPAVSLLFATAHRLFSQSWQAFC